MKSFLSCLVCLTLWWALPALADLVCDDVFGTVCIETAINGDQVTFYGENRHAMLPVTLAVNLELQNLQRQSGSSEPFVLDGQSRVALFTLETRRPGAWRYSYDFTWSRGDVTARHDDKYRYRLPFEAGQAIQIGQG